MDFENPAAISQENQDITIKASDIILLPYNPDGDNAKAGND